MGPPKRAGFTPPREALTLKTARRRWGGLNPELKFGDAAITRGVDRDHSRFVLTSLESLQRCNRSSLEHAQLWSVTIEAVNQSVSLTTTYVKVE